MDSLPDELRGSPVWECADVWAGTDQYFALVQQKSGEWMVYVPSPDRAKVEKRGPILASNVALDVAIELWEEINGRKVPSEFGFARVHWSESVSLS